MWLSAWLLYNVHTSYMCRRLASSGTSQFLARRLLVYVRMMAYYGKIARLYSYLVRI